MIEQLVLTHLRAIVAEHAFLPVAVDTHTLFDELALDSVAFTALLARLEQALGCIPAALLQGLDYPATVGELIAMYEQEVAAA